MRYKLLGWFAAFIIAGGAFSAPVQQYLGSSAAVAEAATAYVLNPAASIKSGTYYSKTGFYVRLSYPGTDADIYYSLNGGSYKLYTDKIPVTKNTTLKFYAQKNGFNSKVIVRSYKLAAKTTISHASGSYKGAQTVTFKSDAPNVKFYYTTDGSKPTTSSKQYNGKGVKITESCTLRVLAYKQGWKNYLYTREYLIEQPVKTAKHESVLENYTAKYAYSTLTPLQKTLYTLIYDGVAEHKAKIDLSSYSVTPSDLNTAFYAMDYENPQFFWLASGYSYSYRGSKVMSVSPNYARSKSEAASIAPKLEAAAAAIISEANQQSSDFDRVLYIHDAIVDATTYTTLGGEYKRDVDGPLVNGKALCEGYSKTFAYLAQSLGYDTICVSGKGNSGDHMWNMIKLDGSWYYMDVTFDDPVSAVPMCSHDYFCITEKQLLETHIIDNVFPVPAATATKYNYYNGSGITYHTNVTGAYNELVRKAADNYQKGILTTEVYCNEVTIEALMSKVNGNIFTSLKTYGCNPSGVRYGFQGSRFYLTLS